MGLTSGGLCVKCKAASDIAKALTAGECALMVADVKAEIRELHRACTGEGCTCRNGIHVPQ